MLMWPFHQHPEAAKLLQDHNGELTLSSNPQKIQADHTSWSRHMKSGEYIELDYRNIKPEPVSTVT